MTDRLEERWHRCKASIGQRISPEDAATWLAGLQLHEVQPHRIVLGGIPNSFFRNRIVRRFRPLIVDTLRDSFPDVGIDREPVLELQVGLEPLGACAATQADAGPGNGLPVRSPWPATPPDTSMDNAADGPGSAPADAAMGWPGRLTFGTFLSAPGNESALQFAQAVAAAPGERYNPLLLVGASGLGKTHLLQAVAQALRGRGLPGEVLVVTGEAFKNEVLDGITRKRMPDVRERYRAAGALLLDDLGFLLVSPKAQEELLHTLDVLHRAGRQLVLTADRFPRALGGLGDALRSRLEMGLIAELNPPDAPARRALVLRRAAEAGLDLPEVVATLLAERITHNLRRLEGAVVRLAAHAALNGSPGAAAGAAGRTIGLDFAERMAAPFFDTPAGAAELPVPSERILERVADRFGITVRALKGRGRSPHLAGARRIAVHLLKVLGACSYSEIGTVLGNRSHSTMVHAHQTLQGDLARDPHLQSAVQQLARTVSEG